MTSDTSFNMRFASSGGNSDSHPMTHGVMHDLNIVLRYIPHFILQLYMEVLQGFRQVTGVGTDGVPVGPTGPLLAIAQGLQRPQHGVNALYSLEEHRMWT